MKKEIDFYIDIFEHLLQLEKIYCCKGNREYSCDECKFVTKNHINIMLWKISLKQGKDVSQKYNWIKI